MLVGLLSVELSMGGTLTLSSSLLDSCSLYGLHLCVLGLLVGGLSALPLRVDPFPVVVVSVAEVVVLVVDVVAKPGPDGRMLVVEEVGQSGQKPTSPVFVSLSVSIIIFGVVPAVGGWVVCCTLT